MTDRIPLDHLTSDQYDALCEDLAALRAVSRGYCPACGRGDAAPTVHDWEEQRDRADRAEAEIDACRRQQWPHLVAHLAAALANTYELTIDDVLAEAHAAIGAKQAAPAATQAADGGKITTPSSPPDWGTSEDRARFAAKVAALEQQLRAAENALAHARSLHRENCPLAQRKVGSAAFTCGMCDALDQPQEQP